jgi:hypothetical protein
MASPCKVTRPEECKSGVQILVENRQRDLPLTRPPAGSNTMALVTSGTIAVQCVATPEALNTLLQSFDGLPNNPASLYLSTTAQSLIIYVTPKRTISVTGLPYLIEALRQKERSASTLKSLLETGPAIKVLFDARQTAKTLFDSCAIRLSNPVCFTQPGVEKVLTVVCSLAPYELTFTKCR